VASTITESLQALELEPLKEMSVSAVGDSGFLIRSGALTESDRMLAMNALRTDFAEQGPEQERFESIGPSIGQELRTKSTRAIIILIIVVAVYIALVFRGMSSFLSPWAMGLAAMIALMHDIVIALGIFAILGVTNDVQITAVFVAAALTILGYSLSDTVVVFDRVRENIQRGVRDSFAAIVHTSVLQTLVRSINTTVTTLAALVAIMFFGGQSLQFFALALIVGITLGSYSSIFVASPLLVWFSRSRRGR